MIMTEMTMRARKRIMTGMMMNMDDDLERDADMVMTPGYMN